MNKRWVYLSAGIGLVMLASIGILAFQVFNFTPYPAATRIQDCGGWNLYTFKNRWMASITRCYAIQDDPLQIENYYEDIGWIRFGVQLSFPNIKVGDFCFEPSKIYVLDLDNAPLIEIYQHKYFVLGYCP